MYPNQSPIQQNGQVQQPAAPQNGYAQPQQSSSPGAALMAMAQGNGQQQPAPQQQFAPPNLQLPQAPMPQMPSMPPMPMAQQPMQQFVPAYAPPTNQPPQLPSQPGLMNPMPQFVPQQQQLPNGLPAYIPPFPLPQQAQLPNPAPPQAAPQQQQFLQPHIAQPQPYGQPSWIPPQQQQPGAGPRPVVGTPPGAPAAGFAQQFAPQQQFVQQQQPPAAPTQRDTEMQRLQSDLAAMRQQLGQMQLPNQQAAQHAAQQAAQQQSQQQSVAARFDLDQWPDVDSLMFAEWRETQRLPDGRTVTDWKPNTPVNVRAAGEQYLQHLAQWENALLYQPHKVLPDLIRKYVKTEAERLVNDRVSASENMTRVDMLLASNDWLFGNDPATGHMTLNEYGRKMVALADYKPGQPITADDVRNLETALQQVRLERERDTLRQQLQAVQYGSAGSMVAGQQPGQLPFAPPVQPYGQLSPQQLPAGVQPMYPQMPQPQPGITGMPVYQHPMTPQQQPQMNPAASQQLNQRLSQLDRMAQNTANRNGSFGQPGVQVPSQQPPQNNGMSAGTKLMQAMRFGTAQAA